MMGRKWFWRASGALGLIANAGVTALLVIWLRARDGRSIVQLPASASRGDQGLILEGHAMYVLFAILFILALLEIPVMVAGLRALAVAGRRSFPFLCAAHSVFVFFAAGYAALFAVFTLQQWLSVIIAATGAVRFASALLFARPA